MELNLTFTNQFFNYMALRANNNLELKNLNNLKKKFINEMKNQHHQKYEILSSFQNYISNEKIRIEYVCLNGIIIETKSWIKLLIKVLSSIENKNLIFLNTNMKFTEEQKKR